MLTNLVREQRQTLSISIGKNGEMLIKAPTKMPLNEILEFVQQKEKWILKKQNQIKECLRTNEPILNYKKILYLGNAYNVINVNYLKTVKFEGKNILVPDSFGEGKNLVKNIELWLKSAALNVIENRVFYLAKIFNLSFAGLKLFGRTARWGSCDASGNLGFNWKLVMLPPSAIDYVIIHELAHLFELNHSERFWLAVEQMMPDYEKNKQLVKSCAYVLTLFEKNK